MGIRYAVQPKALKKMAAIFAPTKPIQFFVLGRAPPVEITERSSGAARNQTQKHKHRHGCEDDRDNIVPMRMLCRLASLLLKQSGPVRQTKINVVVLINLAACRANFHFLFGVPPLGGQRSLGMSPKGGTPNSLPSYTPKNS